MFDIYKPRCLIYIAQLFSKKLTGISTPIFAYKNTGIYSGIWIRLSKILHAGDDNNNNYIVSAIAETAVLGTFHTWSLTTPETGGNILSLQTGNWGSIR